MMRSHVFPSSFTKPYLAGSYDPPSPLTSQKYRCRFRSIIAQLFSSTAKVCLYLT